MSYFFRKGRKFVGEVSEILASPESYHPEPEPHPQPQPQHQHSSGLSTQFHQPPFQPNFKVETNSQPPSSHLYQFQSYAPQETQVSPHPNPSSQQYTSYKQYETGLGSTSSGGQNNSSSYTEASLSLSFTKPYHRQTEPPIINLHTAHTPTNHQYGNVSLHPIHSPIASQFSPAAASQELQSPPRPSSAPPDQSFAISSSPQGGGNYEWSEIVSFPSPKNYMFFTEQGSVSSSSINISKRNSSQGLETEQIPVGIYPPIDASVSAQHPTQAPTNNAEPLRIQTDHQGEHTSKISSPASPQAEDLKVRYNVAQQTPSHTVSTYMRHQTEPITTPQSNPFDTNSLQRAINTATLQSGPTSIPYRPSSEPTSGTPIYLPPPSTRATYPPVPSHPSSLFPIENGNHNQYITDTLYQTFSTGSLPHEEESSHLSDKSTLPSTLAVVSQNKTGQLRPTSHSQPIQPLIDQHNLTATHVLLRKGGQIEPLGNAIRVERNGKSSQAKKILSLDGGGIRGLSSLIILQHLMNKLEDERGGRLEPWQEFDMIAGTSTGGLLAIMLGRLKMSVGECIEAYTTMSRDVFTPVRAKANTFGRAIDKFRLEGKFESKPLEDSIKWMLQNRGLLEDELLKDEDDESPKVFVCAVQGSNSDAVVIRSYKSGSGEYDSLFRICKVWEAARATSAASTFFDSIKIGHQRYIDGALRYNNPIDKADQESRELWPGEDRIIISIGTGSAPGPNALGNAVDLAKTLAKIVTDSENENNKFRRRNRAMVDANRLFRFNVTHGVANIGLDEWEAVEELEAHTETYLRHTDVAREFEKCAITMKMSGQRLGYIVGEELNIHRRVQQLSDLYGEFCEDCRNGVPYNNDMFYCVQCHMNICKDCHEGHDYEHARTMVRFELIQWMARLTDIKPSVACRYCAKESKTRFECKSCDFALCRPCLLWLDRRKESFRDHQAQHPSGRAFIATYPRFWFTKQKSVSEKCPCYGISTPRCAIHCERCSRILRVGERFYWCRTCKLEFGSTQKLCLDCYNEDEMHRAEHEFFITDIMYENIGIESISDAIKRLWGCASCYDLRIPQGKEQNHEHLHLLYILNPLLVEGIRIHNYQSCNRSKARENSVAYPDPAEYACTLCNFHLSFEQTGSICVQRNCKAIFCTSCTRAQRCGHRHDLIPMVLKRPPRNSNNQVSCSYCLQEYFFRGVEGLWCPDCGNHYLCISCFSKLKEGELEVPNGLPHLQNDLKPCEVKAGWIHYRHE